LEIDKIKEQISKAKEAVEGLPEPLKTEAFRVVLSRLLEDISYAERTPTGTALLAGKDEETPPPLSGVTSCREAIAKLFASDWGKKPRNLSQIIDAMELNAIYYSKQAVAVELKRMTQLGILRRLRTAEGFAYVSGKPVSAM
jgi:hypothetical protein